MITDGDFKNLNYNFLGINSVFKGEIELFGDSIITSKIHGDIIVKNQGKLIIERGAEIKGKIHAIDIEIFGEVFGEIIASGTVSIRASAFIQGKITAGKLVIYPGAIVESEAYSTNS